MSTTVAKTSVWKHELDVRVRRHKQRAPNTNDHHMPLIETPHENFLRTPLAVAIVSYSITFASRSKKNCVTEA